MSKPPHLDQSTIKSFKRTINSALLILAQGHANAISARQAPRSHLVPGAAGGALLATVLGSLIRHLVG